MRVSILTDDGEIHSLEFDSQMELENIKALLEADVCIKRHVPSPNVAESPLVLHPPWWLEYELHDVTVSMPECHTRLKINQYITFSTPLP